MRPQSCVRFEVSKKANFIECMCDTVGIFFYRLLNLKVRMKLEIKGDNCDQKLVKAQSLRSDAVSFSKEQAWI